MRDKVFADVITAMKNKDKDRLLVIRMLKGAIQNKEIEIKRELNDDEVVELVGREVKTRKESIEQFLIGNRPDLANKTQSEVEILVKYLPLQLTQEEIANIINDLFLELKPTSPKDLGRIMGVIMPKVKGKADMALVNKMIREKLEKI